MRRGGERQMALAAEKPRGGVEPNPTGARQIDLAPGVQVGEILLGTGRSIERFQVGAQLN